MSETMPADHYEAALREIAAMPSGRHVTLDSERPWDTSYVLDGHERCVEVAKRALGIAIEEAEAHPLDLYALGKRIADESAS